MRVVLDTNVFASGIFWKGPPFQILNAWKLGKFVLIVSKEIFDEYERILAELSIKRPGVNASKFLDLVSVHAEFVNAPIFAKPVCTDSDDDKFLAAALSGNADYVVTGDKALLKTSGFQGIEVVEPVHFLKLVRNGYD